MDRDSGHIDTHRHSGQGTGDAQIDTQRHFFVRFWVCGPLDALSHMDRDSGHIDTHRHSEQGTGDAQIGTQLFLECASVLFTQWSDTLANGHKTLY